MLHYLRPAARLWLTKPRLALLALAFAVLAQSSDQIALGVVLTAAGATIVAPIITGIVAILEGTFSWVAGHQRITAFVLSVLVVGSAVIDAIQHGEMELSLGTVFAGVLAWYGIGRLSLTVHDDVTGKANSLTGPSTQ